MFRRLQSHGTLVTVLAFAGMFFLGAFAILLLVSAISGMPLLSMVNLKGSERICVEKPMKLVSKEGVYFRAGGVSSSTGDGFEGSSGGSLLTPTPGEWERPSQDISPIRSLAFLELPFHAMAATTTSAGRTSSFAWRCA
jgi:hypothetical protein